MRPVVVSRQESAAPPTPLRDEPVGQRFFVLGTAAASLVALVLAGATLGREPLWRDELLTVGIVSRPFTEFVELFPQRHNGLLFDLALWPIVRLGGDGSLWLRLPSLLAFAAAVAVCALVGARLAGRAVGLCAAFLFALHPFAVPYGQEARPYAFFLLFSLLAVWTLLRALESPSFPRWLAYSLSLAALGYSHDLALLSVLAHPLLLVGHWGRVWRGFALSLVAAAAMLIPLAAMLIHPPASVSARHVEGALEWLQEPSVRDLVGIAARIGGSEEGSAVCLLVLAAGAVSLVRRRRLGRPLPFPPNVLAFAAVWLAAPVLVLAVVSFARPILLARYVISSVPALCLLLALALSLLRPRLALAGALLVGAAFLAVSLQDATRKQKEDWPEAAAYIAARTAATEPIAIPGETSSNANGLLYYWPDLPDNQRSLVYLQRDLAASPLPIVPVNSGSEATDLSKIAAGGRGFWLVEAGFIPPSEQADIDRFLSSCKVSLPQDFRGVRVVHVTGCRDRWASVSPASRSPQEAA
jgi:mannosyltransferase